MNRAYYSASALSGCCWFVVAAIIGYPYMKSSLLGGAIASPFIGILVGHLFIPAHKSGKGLKVLLSLVTLYLAAALFGLAGGLGDVLSSSTPNRIASAVVLQGLCATLWGITFTGFFIFLWPLSYMNHKLLGRLVSDIPAGMPCFAVLPVAQSPERQPLVKPRAQRLIRLLGLVMLAAAVFETGRTLVFLWNSWETEGTIVEFTRRRSSRATPIIEWRGLDGKPRRVEPRINDRNSPRYKVFGERVKVRYNPSDPENARVDYFIEHWSFALLFWFLGLVLTLIDRRHRPGP